MIAFALLVVVAAAPCDSPGLAMLPEPQRAAACEFLEREPPEERLARPALTAIYEREGFERARQRNSGAFQAFLAQLRAWFERLIGSSGAETYSNVTRVVVLALAIALALIVSLRLLAHRRRSAVQREQPPTPRALELDDPAVHRARARQLLDSEPREATREALLSLLSSLERRRLARPDRVKTNRELAEELPARGAPPELVRSVLPLLAWFDQAFYSLSPIGPAEARRFLADVEAVNLEPGP
ncbi:MAG: hypothetical protein ACOZQL_43475 [Myxococcota bacterium]